MNEDKKIYLCSTWDLKKAQIKAKAGEVWNSTKNFVKENKEWVLGIGVPLLIGTASSAIKNARRDAAVKETQRLKDNYIWDPRHGMYFETRRKMTTAERLEYARRRDNGEGVESILRSMKILK